MYPEDAADLEIVLWDESGWPHKHIDPLPIRQHWLVRSLRPSIQAVRRVECEEVNGLIDSISILISYHRKPKLANQQMGWEAR